MATKKTDSTGLHDRMPLAPGNAKAGQPPRRSEAGGGTPSWLDGSQAKWTKSRVAAFDQSLRSKAALFSVQESTLPAVDGFQILS
jgi:hypothetical protein